MEKLWYDLSHGVRTLLKNPGFTAVAVFSLAIGIGANSAMIASTTRSSRSVNADRGCERSFMCIASGETEPNPRDLKT